MINNSHRKYIQQILNQHFKDKKYQAFIFGSSLYKDNFFDIDIGIMGNIDLFTLANVKEEFEQSNFPYKVDIVDFTKVSQDFKNFILNKSKILWLTKS